MTQVHMLWVEGRLSPIEVLSCRSFFKNGYDVNLWTYGSVDNIPTGVAHRDANTIIPKQEIFTVRGSHAPFADLWRLAVLNKCGGMWADLDAIAIKPEQELPKDPFLVTEDIWEGSWRKDKPWTITNCIIHNPNPSTGNLIDLVFDYAFKFPKDKIEWSTIGPNLLHNIQDIYPGSGFVVQPVTFANSIPAGEIVNTVLKPGTINPRAHFLHLYNDMWRREGIDKHNLDIPKNSILDNLFDQYY